MAATSPRICLVSASGQNVFFAEILDAFGAALRDRGVVVEESIDCFPPPADDLVYLYVPHEYHPLVEDLSHPTRIQLGRSIALCTEQPGTQWFELTCKIAAEAGAVVDINALGVAELERRGITVEHAPLGYVPAWDAWGGDPGRERTVDLAFLGGHTDRRAQALARCAPVLEGRKTAIHLVESAAPHPVGHPSFIAQERKWELLADSRVLLNVHRTSLGYMEWHRIVGAILNGCVVLSEHSLGVEPLVPGEHFVATGYNAIPNVLEVLLHDLGRQDEIRQAAYDLIRAEMPMAVAVDAVLAAAERAARGALPASAAVPPPGLPLPKAPPERSPDWEAFAESAGEMLPLRTALKDLVVRTRRLERQIHELGLGVDGDGPRDQIEHLGPKLEEPTVSVILTVHNYADYVGEALHSVALSDLDGIEVVAVDDASTDHSVEAIRTACAEVPWLTVTLVRRARNGGLPAARNLAVEHARADRLFILDADNSVLPGGIGKLARALEERPDAAFAYGIVQAFSINGPVGVMNWLDWEPRRLRYGNYIDAMSMIRRSALAAVGGYSTEASLYGWEDFALWAAMASAGLDGIRVPEFVARYRVSAHSMISLTNIDSSAAWATLLRRYPLLA
jgi:hypothetical protein